MEEGFEWLASPAKDSGLDSEKLVDSSKQRNTVITVYVRQITGWLCRGELRRVRQKAE